MPVQLSKQSFNCSWPFRTDYRTAVTVSYSFFGNIMGFNVFLCSFLKAFEHVAQFPSTITAPKTSSIIAMYLVVVVIFGLHLNALFRNMSSGERASTAVYDWPLDCISFKTFWRFVEESVHCLKAKSSVLSPGHVYDLVSSVYGTRSTSLL